MVKIRLMRRGKRHAPFYRIVASHKASPRDGRFIENLGYYDPSKDPAIVKLHEDRVIHWLEHGAEATDTVRSLLKREGLLRRWREGISVTPSSAEAPAPTGDGDEV